MAAFSIRPRILDDAARPSRRTFVKGLAMGGAIAGFGLRRPAASAQTDTGQQPALLDGTEFDLTIGETPMDFTGSPRLGVTVNGSLPAPTLRWREGDTVTVRVANTLGEDTSIHWHGVLVPANMDGVPGFSFDGIRPGETHTYRFTVRQGGTYWYHSHSGFQEQRGLYGALLIEPLEPEPFRYDREHVVLLSDWTDEDPDRVFAKLKKQDDHGSDHSGRVIAQAGGHRSPDTDSTDHRRRSSRGVSRRRRPPRARQRGAFLRALRPVGVAGG